MNQRGFEDYTYFAYGHTTGTANSYIMAIRILDRIFATEDLFHLRGKSLTEIDDEFLCCAYLKGVSHIRHTFKLMGEIKHEVGGLVGLCLTKQTDNLH